MERLTNIGSNGEIWITDNDETRRNGRKESAYKKLAEYEDLEERLNGVSVKQVVDGFIKTVENQTNEEYEHGRILTNTEADKWNEYKRLEEQGLLLRLPVPIGTTVYKFEPLAKGTERYIKTTVTRYEVFDDSIWFTFANGLGRNIEDFGKYVFLTQAEAEQKLKEMEDK